MVGMVVVIATKVGMVSVKVTNVGEVIKVGIVVIKVTKVESFPCNINKDNHQETPN